MLSTGKYYSIQAAVSSSLDKADYMLQWRIAALYCSVINRHFDSLLYTVLVFHSF